MNGIVTINMDAKCAECGKLGATDSGVCLRCITKAIDPAHKMKSRQGKAVQQRFAAFFPWAGYNQGESK